MYVNFLKLYHSSMTLDKAMWWLWVPFQLILALWGNVHQLRPVSTGIILVTKIILSTLKNMIQINKYSNAVFRCTNELGWRSTFEEYFREYGKYMSCYRDIRKAWNQIETYFILKGGHDMPVLKSLNGENLRKIKIWTVHLPTSGPDLICLH